MERNAIEFVQKHGSESQKKITQEMLSQDSTEAFLLIEVDGNDMDNLFTDCEKINEVLESNNASEVQFADSSDQKERIWQIRRNIGEMVKLHSIFKEEDTVVKRANLPKLMAGVKAIGKEYHFESVCYGHAGDGTFISISLKGQCLMINGMVSIWKKAFEKFSDYVKNLAAPLVENTESVLFRKNI
jgi:glycolate oxidase